jgi:hypothetical protein
MAIKYTNIFNCKTLPKFTQIKIFGLKIYHLATLIDLTRYTQLQAPQAETQTAGPRR